MQSGRSRRDRALVFALGALVVVLFVVLTVLSERARSRGGAGIISLEFVGTNARAAKFVVGWDERGRDAIEASLWLDYVFMVAYAAFFGILVSRAADRAGVRGFDDLARLGENLRWAPVAAAGFDAIENAALLLIVKGGNGGSAPAIGTAAACVKFALLFVVFGYLARVGWALRRDARPSSA